MRFHVIVKEYKTAGNVGNSFNGLTSVAFNTKADALAYYDGAMKNIVVAGSNYSNIVRYIDLQERKGKVGYMSTGDVINETDFTF